MNKDTGGPAFPCKVYVGDRWNQQTKMSEPQYLEQPGAVTLRDYFAAKAMQGLIERGFTEFGNSASAYATFADAQRLGNKPPRLVAI